MGMLLLALGLGPAPQDGPDWTAFRALAPERRQELVAELRESSRELPGERARWIAAALALSDRPARAWPPESAPAVYEPEVHAPGAAARYQLDDESATVRALRERMLGRREEPELQAAWSYDWGSREPRCAADADDPERIFRNAIAGFAPDQDLAEVLVLRALDDGSHSRVLAALGHAYTNREGGVYPGLTLYDALASREQIEMPDVDCLGIIHDVLGDWETWKAPVPPAQHARLYARIQELFLGARVHRSVREALARVHLRGSAQVEPRMRPNVDRFHALWASLDSDPERLAAELPSAPAWKDWLAEAGRRLDTDAALYEAGIRRRDVLDADARAQRDLALQLLGEIPRGDR